MTQFYKASETPVEHYATKYDDCTLKATGNPYRHQKGSGRSEVISRFAADGKRLGDITKEAAEQGFDPNFVVGSLFKHHDTPGGAWIIVAPEGQTLEDIKKLRKERRVSAEVLAKREAKAAEKEAKRQEREAAKAEREAAKGAKAAEREAAKAAREAEKEAKRQEREAAKAARAEARQAEGGKVAGKGKGKKAPAGEADASGEDAAAA